MGYYDKINAKDLMFEVTRMCNLNCKHCMRGEQVNNTLSERTIDEVLKQINAVKTITLTGGEPMLVPRTVNYLADSIIKNNIKLLSFSFVTNGTILDDRAIKTIEAVNKISKYIYEEMYIKNNASNCFEFDTNEIGVISISDSEYHANDVKKAYEFYNKYVNEFTKIDIQSEWEYVTEEGEVLTHKEANEKMSHTWVYNCGRAKTNNIGFKEVNYTSVYDNTMKCSNLCHRLEIDDNYIQCPLIITANNNLTLVKQTSFENEDLYNMGNVLKEPLKTLIDNWQWKEPLLCKELELLLECKTQIEHNENNSEEDKKYFETFAELLMSKREYLKDVHKECPNLSYEEVVKCANAIMNIKTEGKYNEIMALHFPNDYDANYIYDEAKEMNEYYSLCFADYGMQMFNSIRGLFKHE